MKLGIGLYRNYRKFISYLFYISFVIKLKFIGFDFANQYLQRVDRLSIQRILKKYGATIGNNCECGVGIMFHNCKDYSNLIIGNNCHIGKNCFFDLKDKIILGDNVVVSMHTIFITHINLHKSSLASVFHPKAEPIIIMDNCYIGVRATVLKGVTIRSNSFVAAGSLVIDNVEESQLVGGVPAKLIRKI